MLLKSWNRDTVRVPSVHHHDLFDPVALADVVDHLKSFHYLAKTGMHAVQVSGIVAGMADKKL